MASDNAGRFAAVLGAVVVALGVAACSPNARSAPVMMKAEVVKAAVGTSRMALSPSERYLTIERRRAPRDTGPRDVRVLDRTKQDSEVTKLSGWVVGPADDNGDLIYVEQAADRASWTVRSSRRTTMSRALVPPTGHTWELRAAVRAGGHAVVAFAVVSVPGPGGTTAKAWAASVDLANFSTTSTREFVVNRGFDQNSMVASGAGNAVYWTARPTAGAKRIELVSSDAATLKPRWTTSFDNPGKPAVSSPNGNLAVTGDGKYVLAALGDRRHGSVSTDALYGIRTSDGARLFGPSTQALVHVQVHDVFDMAPVPGAPSVAMLLVYNTRDDHDAFFRVRVVDLAGPRIAGEVTKAPRTNAIAVSRSGAVLIAPK